MTNLTQIVTNVRHRLSGAGAYTPQVFELAEDITEATTSFQVDPAGNRPSSGIYEIGLERIRVKSVSANTLQTFTFGRGYEGSVAAVHNTGSEVVKSPLIPAGTIAQEINGVLSEFYPRLYGIVNYDVEYDDQFRLPDEATGVVAVFLADVPIDGWRRTDRYRWEPDANKGLLIYGAEKGTPVRVTYGTRPGLFDLTADDVQSAEFTETTGLDERLIDLLTLGVAYRLAPMADMGRLNSVGADPRADGDAKPPGQGMRLQQLFYRQFQQRLAEEQQVLHKEHPIRVSKTRGL